MSVEEKEVEYLVVDTTAFIQNAPLQDVGKTIVTCQEVVDEIINKRQLRRLVVLPYDLQIKNVFPENVVTVTEFAKKTGDYSSLSATDIKVMALTYQLEKEHVGTDHLRTEPIVQKTLKITTKQVAVSMNPDISGFYMPKKKAVNEKKELREGLEQIDINSSEVIDSQEVSIGDIDEKTSEHEWVSDDPLSEDTSDIDDDVGWITPSNVARVKKEVNSELMEEKHVKVACITTDFAMQNVLKQMNLNVSALDGRIIKQLRTFILRCYTCFKTTSIMTKVFCPKCGNNTLKKVAVSVDEEGKLQIHINGKKPLTARGKKFSLPRIRGGKHPNNPILVEDQPMADNKPTRLARTKNNPMDTDYIAGFSPFIMRDVTSKSAQLCIRPGQEMKHWMRKNPNEARRKRK